MKRLLVSLMLVVVCFALMFGMSGCKDSFAPNPDNQSRKIPNLGDTRAIAASNPANSKPWYAGHSSEGLRGLLDDWTFEYKAPTSDDWRIDGYLLAYGAEPATNGIPADIVVIKDDDKNEMVIQYHGITRRITRVRIGYRILVNRVVIEMAQLRLKELAKELDQHVIVKPDGTVIAKEPPFDPTQKR